MFPYPIFHRQRKTGDSVAPTLVITCTQTSPTSTSPLNFTFTFSETVTGFVLGDITVANGVASNFAGSGSVYTCDVTPTGMSIVTVNVAAGVCTDAAGNANEAAAELAITSTATFSDAFTRADGAIGNNWTGSTWTVLSNAVVNTPVAGAEDISNGNMETGDPPTGWTASNSAVLDSVADERTGGSGAAALSVTNNGATFGKAYQTLDAAAGTWILINGWIKRVTSANAQLLLQTSGETTLAYVSSTTADTWVNAVFTGFTSGANCRIVAADSNTSGGEHRYDDISVKPLTLSELFAYRSTGTSDVTAQVVITTSPGNKHGGLMLNLDSTSNPLNYVVAYLSAAPAGALQARLDKCVNGVISNVITGNVTFGATKYLKVKKLGNDYSLYYGTTDVQVGTTQVVASMNGTIHGLFGTGGGVFDSYQLEATPPNP